VRRLIENYAGIGAMGIFLSTAHAAIYGGKSGLLELAAGPTWGTASEVGIELAKNLMEAGASATEDRPFKTEVSESIGRFGLRSIPLFGSMIQTSLLPTDKQLGEAIWATDDERGQAYARMIMQDMEDVKQEAMYRVDEGNIEQARDLVSAWNQQVGKRIEKLRPYIKPGQFPMSKFFFSLEERGTINKGHEDDVEFLERMKQMTPRIGPIGGSEDYEKTILGTLKDLWDKHGDEAVGVAATLLAVMPPLPALKKFKRLAAKRSMGQLESQLPRALNTAELEFPMPRMGGHSEIASSKSLRNHPIFMIEEDLLDMGWSEEAIKKLKRETNDFDFGRGFEVGGFRGTRLGSKRKIAAEEAHQRISSALGIVKPDRRASSRVNLLVDRYLDSFKRNVDLRRIGTLAEDLNAVPINDSWRSAASEYLISSNLPRHKTGGFYYADDKKTQNKLIAYFQELLVERIGYDPTGEILK